MTETTVSRVVETNQFEPHERLSERVTKHLETPYLRPVADHSKRAFEEVSEFVSVSDAPVILDSCCGVGDSSRALAESYVDHIVVGVDKSQKRLMTERMAPNPENMILVRADLNDFFRLIVTADWNITKHYLLYPNPWPKKAHLGRRWHGAPVFPALLQIGKALELRSNWKLYLEEFSIALGIGEIESEISAFTPQSYLTPFEKKYHQSGQRLWKLQAKLKGK